jgi:hypothetical protein
MAKKVETPSDSEALKEFNRQEAKVRQHSRATRPFKDRKKRKKNRKR